jgi:Family of unknown function (DUF6247)
MAADLAFGSHSSSTRADRGGINAVSRCAGTGGQCGTPHNRAMATPTVTTWIDRTGQAVRDALVMLDSQACIRFEVEFHTAIAETQVDFDATRITDVVDRWWAYAIAEANPDPEADAVWVRIKAGDESDIVEQWRLLPDGSHDVYRKNAADEWTFSYRRPAVEA